MTRHNDSAAPATDLEREVLDRYAQGAAAVQPELCCPTQNYDPRYLEAIPREVLEKDYGCGDPSKWAREGDTVIDLGSGAGKACFMIAQRVGPSGAVLGVDFNDAMLALARKHQPAVAAKIGYDNVRFFKAHIQDMGRDLENPGGPGVPSGGSSLVVSNCVLNLVKPGDKRKLFDEIFRVLMPGGRAVISDVVCDREPTAAIMADPKLWSGCISGAFREEQLPWMFLRAGFTSFDLLARQEEPWQVIDGVEFRSVTIRATKPGTPDAATGEECCGGGRCC